MSNSTGVGGRGNQIWRRWIHAVTFYTRIPWPSNMAFDSHDLIRGNVFFPLIGWLVAGFAALVCVVTLPFFDPSIAILLSMIATIWLTGAFHEDGFADTCDGFGGGYGQQAILTIMKDSRVGTYASVGLCLLLLLKYQSLLLLPQLLLGLWLGHSLSRFVPLLLMTGLPYVREQADSKVGAAELKLTRTELVIAALFAAVPLLLIEPEQVLVLVVVMAVLTYGLYRWFKSVLGGITGDCLGASQQISEAIVYVVLGATCWNAI
ncbi:adenosylcobinamide-GDP ribazoletransferase [Motilimonas eburnea]|uniref:adenosylcobinamide-GDP ribazoletransferase n=1 Tax=Motilimonas eburnea TaxID=1737488 RepID=UPI001E415E5E|nr:adenosylcobinamide-GDP ribazoletransferase [Motilimonas eburnea]MCE2571577.1 adenosylcobinamide-GDP ribazoletransferase [Motilimonas eburnea]